MKTPTSLVVFNNFLEVRKVPREIFFNKHWFRFYLTRIWSPLKRTIVYHKLTTNNVPKKITLNRDRMWDQHVTGNHRRMNFTRTFTRRISRSWNRIHWSNPWKSARITMIRQKWSFLESDICYITRWQEIKDYELKKITQLFQHDMTYLCKTASISRKKE